MKLFFRYLRTRMAGIWLFLACTAVFAAGFALYRLPLTAVLYPAVICLFLYICYLAADYLRVRRVHQTLRQLAGVGAALIRDLPKADTVAEADYQALVGALQEEIAAVCNADAARYREMIDYYTVWAHQIKTPIAAMKLTLQNEDSPLCRKLSSDLFRIEQYVEMVLAFLRLGEDANDYVFKEYKLDDIIRPTVRKLASQFIDRKLTLCYEPIPDTVVTDAKWLAFVIEQVLSNALKYTKEGTVTVAMGSAHVLCISDTGIGIAPSDLPRVFEKGYTGLNGRDDRTASGIGLYLCRRICRRLGIGISIRSEEGRGTAVSLDLAQYPLKKD